MIEYCNSYVEDKNTMNKQNIAVENTTAKILKIGMTDSFGPYYSLYFTYDDFEKILSRFSTNNTIIDVQTILMQ